MVKFKSGSFNPGKQEESQDKCLVAAVVIRVFMVIYFLVFYYSFYGIRH
jgi:zona occludens toxin (predicted ATPase)